MRKTASKVMCMIIAMLMVIAFVSFTGERVDAATDEDIYIVWDEADTRIYFVTGDEPTGASAYTYLGACSVEIPATSVQSFISQYRSSVTTIDFSVQDGEGNDVEIALSGSAAYLFSNCASLTQINGLEYLDTSSVVNMCGMFSGCNSLASLDLSSLDTSNVTNMYQMFYGCSSLAALDISHFDTSKVVDMKGMFTNCSKLEVLDLSSFDVSSVTAMGTMFSGCSSLKSLDLSTFNTISLTTMDNMFSGCSSLETLDISGLKTSNVKSMISVFSSCRSLTDIDLSGLDTANVTNMFALFSGCSSLRSLDVSSLDTSKVTNMGGMFQNCSSLTELDLTDFDTSNSTSMFAMFSGCSSLRSLDVSSFDTSNVTTMNGMFMDCSSLDELDLSNFDTSKVTTMVMMFSCCASLEEVDVSSFDTSGVTSMMAMFYNCASLETLDVTSFDTSEVTNMYVMFTSCSSLEELDVSSFDTSNVTNMYAMFSNCGSLKTLDLHSFNTSNVTNMGAMFNRCTSLESIDVSSFDTSNVTNFNGTFNRCTALAELDVSSFDTSKAENMSLMFGNDVSLRLLKTGDAWTQSAVTSSRYATYPKTLYRIDDESYDEYGTSDNVIEGTFVERYTVSFDANTDTYEGSTDDIYYYYTQSVVLPECGFTSSGKTFTEWNTKADGTGTSLIPSTEYTDVFTYGDVTVYAQWNEVHIHNYGEPAYTWAEDNSTVTATRVCANDETHVETKIANTTYAVTTAASCEEAGVGRYTAEFENTAFSTQTKDVTIEAIGHDWDVTDIQWKWSGKAYEYGAYSGFLWDSGVHTVTATVTCRNNSTHTYVIPSKDIDITTERISIDLERYTATFTYEGAEYTDVKEADPLVVWVIKLYTWYMDRDPDEGGLTYWVEALREHRTTASKTLAYFYMCPEFQDTDEGSGVSKNDSLSDEEFITAQYNIVFLRDPDEGGLAYWKSILTGGCTRKKVVEGFANSAEMAQLCEDLGILQGKYKSDEMVDKNPQVTAFVARMFTECLGRAYDEEGLAYWVGELINGTKTGFVVAKQFFGSDELVNSGISNEEFVIRAYKTLMNREPDEEGLAFWVGQIESGAKTWNSVVKGFAYSDEFAEICAEYGITPY